MYSPRKWGWTAYRVERVEHQCVFPTQVGMNRMESRLTAGWLSIPYASGDEPMPTLSADKPYLYSPRKWGWTVLYELFEKSTFQYSLRKWGWTGFLQHRIHQILVFPTQVGMNRDICLSFPRDHRIPHIGGAELSIGLLVLKLYHLGEEKILLILHGKIVKIIFPHSGGNAT